MSGTIEPADERLRPHPWQRSVGSIAVIVMAWAVASSSNQAVLLAVAALVALWVIDLPSAVLITLLSLSLSAPGQMVRITPAFASLLFLSAIVIITLFDWRTLRLRARLAPRQIRLIAFVSLAAVSYATLRYGVAGSELLHAAALAVVLVLSFRDVPGWSAATWAGQLAVRAAIVAAAVTTYPTTPLMTDLYSTVIKPSLARFIG